MLLRQDGSAEPLSEAERNAIEAIKDKWSAQGKRVILVAKKHVTRDLVSELQSANAEKTVIEYLKEGLILVGMWALIDPLVSVHDVGHLYIILTFTHREMIFLMLLKRCMGRVSE